MGILYVVVDRLVVSVHLPVRGNWNVIPRTYVESLLEECQRTLRRLAYEVELPGTVKSHITFVDGLCPGCCIVACIGKHLGLVVVGHICCNTTLFILGKDSLVLPFGRSNLRLLYNLECEPGAAVGVILLDAHHTAIF